MKKSTLFTREGLLDTAHAIITKPTFTREDSSRAQCLMDLAERIGARESRTVLPDDAESRALDQYLRSTRAMGIGTPTQSTATSVEAQQAFRRDLTNALKATDALFNDDVVTVFESATGTPCVFPVLDDTAEAAIVEAESAPEAESYPVISAQLGIPATFRSGIVRLSVELLQDSAFPVAGFLAQSFAVRLARGIGPSLVASLLSFAPGAVGFAALGSGPNTGGSETGATSIGWQDLAGLVGSVNSAYKSLPKCFWLMNANTQASINSVVCKSGQPLIHPVYDDDGRQLILGFPVATSPSMPNIAPTNLPVAFGCFSYFVTRIVQNATRIQTLTERFAEFGQVGYKASMRANGVLLGVTQNGTSPLIVDSPVKFLQCASS